MSNKSQTFKPTLILHGSAGDIRRADVPPELYAKYQTSLQSHLRSAKDLLYNDATALEAATHAVSLMEDDEFFKCGRGSVFTSAGTIEMEASVMVTSVGDDNENDDDGNNQGGLKRAAAVSGLKNVRHPILLARESLLRTGCDENGKPNGDGGSMHMHLAAPYVEDRAKEWGLEFMPDEWFWTQERWEEHRRGLGETVSSSPPSPMTQGTVGCVCLDRWGGLAVATSTGGMTNKWLGRVGDTPTVGAGFWAEAWDAVNTAPLSSSSWAEVDEMDHMEADHKGESLLGSEETPPNTNMRSLFNGWMSSFVHKATNNSDSTSSQTYTPLATTDTEQDRRQKQNRAYIPEQKQLRRRLKRRAVALSGTGNGDSFQRINAARTASAMLRFSPPSSSSSSSSSPPSLAKAVRAIAGPNGELQSSAGRRWGVTAEGVGGLVGIEVEIDRGTEPGTGDDYSNPMAERYHDDSDDEEDLDQRRRGKAVFDFNCGGMWRAWIEEDEDGMDVERVMVFREEYK